MKQPLNILAGIFACSAYSLSANAQIGPDPVTPSDLTLQIEHVGSMPFYTPPGLPGNIASPVPIGPKLYLLDQFNAIYRLNEEGPQKIFDISEAPDGLQLDNRQSVLNVAPGAKPNEIYVALTSSNDPSYLGIDVHRMPAPLPGVCCTDFVTQPVVLDIPDLYRLDPLPNAFFFNLFGPATRTEYQVIYKYKLAGNKLKDPSAIVAFETQSGPTHQGGGMATLPDGRILYATADSLPFGTDGRAAPQDDSSHLSKILIIDPDDGSVEVAAKGIRNVQRLELVDDGVASELTLSFVDIGGVTAEEVNYISVADIVNTATIENFGWGRNADGFAREGTFYIDPGVPGVFGTEPPAVGTAPSPETGFIQPQAQFGRSDPAQFVAITGPVTSSESFNSITALFGVLATGEIYATTDPIDATNATVYSVNLVDTYGNPTTLLDLAGGRPDPRFFRFPDGTAGVLIELTGNFYRLTQIAP